MAKTYVLNALTANKNLAGGLVNYMELINDLKRQDIIQKGLRVHTYEMNNDVPFENRAIVASQLSKKFKRYIKHSDLFYIENDAFYYDKADKTVYAIDLESLKSNLKPMVRTCHFTTDERGNAIGYSVCDWNNYHQQITEETFTEQQSQSEELPKIAEPLNNKLYAESFRFGNAKINDNYRFKIGLPKVLKHLTNRVGIKNADESKLQLVRFYDKNKEIQSRICYYDSAVGRSLVYNSDGQYMYQLEYNRNDFGDIVACARF